MDNITHFRPKENNKLYRYVGVTLAYLKQNKEEAAKSYIKSLPKQLQSQVIETTNTIIKANNGKNIQ